MKEINRRTFLKESLKQIGAIVGIGLGMKALKDINAQEESLAATDNVVTHNAGVGNQMNRILFEHEMRLSQLEGKITPPQKTNGVRKI